MTNKSALVFDDNLACQALLSEVLEEQDFNVTSYADPIDFITEHPETHCPRKSPCVNLILTDNQMPGMTGIELLEQLKKKGCKIADNRKAIISGNWSTDQLSRAKDIGCKIFFKPTPIEEIHAWLNE
jgi:CheY-like chemotaxis protein